MRLMGVLLVGALLAVPVAAQTETQRLSNPEFSLQLDTMPTGQLVVLIMRDIMRVPYVIAPDVLADRKPMSVNLRFPRDQLPVRVVRFLRSIGLTVKLDGGTVYITKGGVQPVAGTPVNVGPVNMPTGNPLDPQLAVAPAARSEIRSDFVNGGVVRSPAGAEPTRVEVVEPPHVFAIVEPAHRPVFEFVDMLDTMLPDVSVSARRASEPRGNEIADREEPERLVLRGPPAMVDRAIELIRLVDKPRPTVDIRAVIFEVRNSTSSKSALSILAELGGIDFGSDVGAVPGEQFVRIATGGLRAILSATKGDGRFKVIAEPSLSALSGTVATINSGSQVPTVGAVSFSEDGAPVRSIVYRDSGVSLTVRPTVRSGEIELAVQQERSSFVRTNTGVDESPTLNRSTASARVAIRPGETIAIAGLDERSEGDSKTGFFGGLVGGRERESDQGQLLLLIQADVAEDTRGGETAVQLLGAIGEGEEAA